MASQLKGELLNGEEVTWEKLEAFTHITLPIRRQKEVNEIDL